MANEVKTIFTAEPSQLFQTINLAEKRVNSLNARINAFSQNPTFGGAATSNTRVIDIELARANAAIDRYRTENIRAERELTKQLESEEKQRTRMKIREAKLANDAAIREIKERERVEKQAIRGGRGSQFGQGVSDGLNIPLGAATIGAIGGAAVIGFGAASLNSSKEAANAQLQLQAITKETGLSYQKLTNQAREFGEVNLLSNREAQSTFSQIANFANAAGRGDKLEEFRKRFSDLAAAKGINASQLGDISRQLNALTDEATDKLLNANPSAFYDKFARSIGTTAEKLTDAQKRAAVFDEVLRKGAIFEGSAVTRFNAATSATDKLAQKYENLKESAGRALLPIAELAEKAASSFLSIEGAQKNFNSNDPEAVRFNRNFLSNQRAAEAANTLRGQDKLIADAIANPLASSLNSELSKINLADSFFNPDNRQKLIDAARVTAQSTADSFKNSFNAVLSDNKSSLDLLKLGQKQFYANQVDYDPATRRQLAESFENSINERAKADAEKAKASREKAKAELDRRADDLKKAADKVKELGRNYSSAFDSLFQRQNSNNPFASIFTEGDKAITDLRKNLAGLSPELKAIAEGMQQKLNADSLFNARLENDFAKFDLGEDANSFRNFKQPKIEDPTKFFNDFIEAGLKQLSSSNGGGVRYSPGTSTDGSFGGFSQSREKPFTRYNSNIFENGKNADGTPKLFTNGFSQSDTRSDLLYNYERTGGFQESSNGKGFGNNLGGFFRRDKTFADLTNREKDDFINKENLPFQDKLSRQIDLAKNSGALNDEQKRTVDRKLISLTQGVDPSKLTGNQRDAAASAREREAERLDQNENKARAQRESQIALQGRIAASNEKLIELAQKGGSEAVVKFVDETTGGVKLPAGATAKDVQKAYDDAYTGGTFYEQSQR